MSDETNEVEPEEKPKPPSAAEHRRPTPPGVPIGTPAAQRRIPQVVSSELVKTEKKTIGMKLRKIFFSGSFQSAGEFAVQEVLFPSIRSTMADFGHSILDNVFMGGRGGYRGGGRGMSGPREFFEPRPRTNYSLRRGGESPFERERERGRSYDDRFPRRRFEDFRLVTITSRLEAERMLDTLNEGCERYGFISVADYYDSVGIVPANTDYKWGWTSLRRVSVVPTRDGWMLDMPAAEPL